MAAIIKFVAISAISAIQMTAPTAPQNPKVLISERFEYYTVDAISAKKLRQQMAERGPTNARGHRSSGLTTHRFEMRFQLQPLAGNTQQCQMQQIEVHADLLTQLPQWQPKRMPSADLKQRWQHMETGLHLHEQGHRANGRWAAHSLHQRLDGLPKAGLCASMQTWAEMERTKVMQELLQREQSYDLETQFGLAQLPLPPEDELTKAMRLHDEDRLRTNMERF